MRREQRNIPSILAVFRKTQAIKLSGQRRYNWEWKDSKAVSSSAAVLQLALTHSVENNQALSIWRYFILRIALFKIDHRPVLTSSHPQ